LVTQAPSSCNQAADPKIGPELGARQHPAERSGARFDAGNEFGSGLMEQDFLAGEPFEFGDELALASDWSELGVPVEAEVGEVGSGSDSWW